MRCFIAIDLPSPIKEYLSQIQLSLPKDDIKLVEKENLHLTLSFLGEIDEYHIERCKQILSEIKFRRFSASLGDIGFFPSRDYIRVVWVSLEPAENIKSLHSEIYDKLRKEFEIDGRFESHITLARVRFIRNKQEFVKNISSLKLEKKEFEADSFALKKSTLTQKGPVYEDVARFEMMSEIC
jgi:2'-5' RNA ligase